MTSVHTSPFITSDLESRERSQGSGETLTQPRYSRVTLVKTGYLTLIFSTYSKDSILEIDTHMKEVERGKDVSVKTLTT